RDICSRLPVKIPMIRQKDSFTVVNCSKCISKDPGSLYKGVVPISFPQRGDYNTPRGGGMYKFYIIPVDRDHKAYMVYAFFSIGSPKKKEVAYRYLFKIDVFAFVSDHIGGTGNVYIVLGKCN